MKERNRNSILAKSDTRTSIFTFRSLRSSQTNVPGDERKERKKDAPEWVYMMKEQKKPCAYYYISFLLFLVRKRNVKQNFRLRIVCV